MLSVTTLTSYLYCMRKLFLTRVLGFKEPIRRPLVKGSIRHEVYDLINKKEEEIVTNITKKTTKEQLYQTYKMRHSKILREVIRNNKEDLKKLELKPNDVFRKTWPLILEESLTRAKRTHNFMETHLVYGKELWESLTPKISSEIKISSEKLKLRGIIDQIEIYEKGIVPVELKTGSCPKQGVWDNHRIQAGAYALLAEEHFNKEIKEAFIVYLDHAQRRHIPINIFLKDEIKELIQKVNLLLKGKELPETERNYNKCRGCGLREICYNNKVIKKQVKKIFNRNI